MARQSWPHRKQGKGPTNQLRTLGRDFDGAIGSGHFPFCFVLPDCLFPLPEKKAGSASVYIELGFALTVSARHVRP